MRYSYPQPAQLNPDAMRAQIASLNLPGFTGITTDGLGNLYVEFPNSTGLTTTQKSQLDGTINNYVYIAPIPPPDVPGFLRALHLDSNLTDAILGTILGDWRGQLCIQAIGVGDFAHAQTLYNQLKASPPTGASSGNIVEVGKVAVANYLPLTP